MKDMVWAWDDNCMDSAKVETLIRSQEVSHRQRYSDYTVSHRQRYSDYQGPNLQHLHM